MNFCTVVEMFILLAKLPHKLWQHKIKKSNFFICKRFVAGSAKINHVHIQKLPTLCCHNLHYGFAVVVKITSHVQKFMANLLKLTE